MKDELEEVLERSLGLDKHLKILLNMLEEEFDSIAPFDQLWHTWRSSVRGFGLTGDYFSIENYTSKIKSLVKSGFIRTISSPDKVLFVGTHGAITINPNHACMDLFFDKVRDKYVLNEDDRGDFMDLYMVSLQESGESLVFKVPSRQVTYSKCEVCGYRFAVSDPELKPFCPVCAANG